MFKSLGSILFVYIVVNSFPTSIIAKAFNVSRKLNIVPNAYIVEFKSEYSKRFSADQVDIFYINHEKFVFYVVEKCSLIGSTVILVATED